MAIDARNMKALSSFAGAATRYCDCIDRLRTKRPRDLYARLEILLQRLHRTILPVRLESPKRKVKWKRMTNERWQELALAIREVVGPQLLILRKWHFPTSPEIQTEHAVLPKKGGAQADLAGTWRRFQERCRQQNIGRDDADRATMLWDDLADIYRELQNGLVLWNRKSTNAKAQAAWEWRFGYENHWGRHLFRAMLTVHEIRYRIGGDVSVSGR